MPVSASPTTRPRTLRLPRARYLTAGLAFVCASMLALVSTAPSATATTPAAAARAAIPGAILTPGPVASAKTVDPGPSTSTAVTVPTFVSRMTARWEAYTDAQGQVWAARSDTLGTTARSTSLVGTDIAGTTDDGLYAVNAQGVTGYRLPVPVAGTYRVRLLMAEEWFTTGGQRVFDVRAEGQPAAGGVDIAKAVGKAAAYDVTFDAKVSDGQLDLAIDAVQNRSLLSAVEVRLVDHGPSIVLTPQAGAELFAARSTADYSAYTDRSGRRWASRAGFVGANSRATTTLLKAPAQGDAPLYQSLTYLTGYGVDVPMAARYQVRLLFTENWFTKAGQRVFDVTAEGHPFITDVDTVADAGHRLAGETSGVVEVTDGHLDLGIINRSDRAQLSAIEVTYFAPLTPVVAPPDTTQGGPDPAFVPFSARMTAGSSPVTDRSGQVWKARTTRFGTSNISAGLAGKDIGGTDDDVLYQTNGWGVSGYLLDVPESATYRVRLLMAEDFFRTPGSRVFDVVAEGKTVAAGVDIVKAVGDRQRAYDLVFDVPVSDGELTLKFLKRVDNPLISAIEVTAADVAQIASTRPAPAVPVRAGSWSTTDISQAPLAENSAAVVADLTHQVERVWNGHAGVNAYSYNAGFYRVSATTPTIRVGFDDCQGKGYVSEGLFTGKAQFVDVPIPDGATPAAGSDAQLTIYDPASDKLWEFWQARKRATGWTACWGGRIDDVSTSDGTFDAPFGATATGISMGATMISIAQAKAGRVGHAMYLGVIDARSGTQSWPANRNDGNVDRADVVTQGQRLRLDPSLDVTKLGLTPFGVMVARAAQRYGFIVADRAGAVSVITESGAATAQQTGANPWDVLLNGPDYNALGNFPWDKMQALPLDYGRP